MDRKELEELKLKAGSLNSRKIIKAITSCGWTGRRGGKHPAVFKKAGYRFSITVQNKMTSGTALGIINMLLDELDERGEHDGKH